MYIYDEMELPDTELIAPERSAHELDTGTHEEDVDTPDEDENEHLR